MSEDYHPELSIEILDKALQRLEDYFIPLERLKLKNAWIGSGGYGVVKLAELISLHPTSTSSTMVAIKDLQDNSRGVLPIRVAYRLAREMTVWSSFRHDNVLEFIGYHLSRDLSTAYLISGYMENGNIKDYLHRNQTTLEERLELVRDTACGLKYLHTRVPPVVHGDLKALNVLINEHRKAVLCDFGLAAAMQDDQTGLTTASGFKGTTRWCSLEVLMGNPTSLESDIWSWGCLVMEIITGNYPYHETPNEITIVLLMVQNQQTPWLLDDQSEMKPKGLLRLVRSCWDFDAKKRPDASLCMASMNEIILLEKSLESILNLFNSTGARWS